jgi:hypothetical protein
MTTGSLESGLGGPRLSPQEELQKKSAATLNRLGLASTLPGPGAEKLQQNLLAQTVNQWVEGARPGVEKTKPMAQEALKSAAQLPAPARGHWEGRMQTLVSYANATPSDPITIIRYLNNIEPEMRQLATLPLALPDGTLMAPGTHPAVRQILETAQAFRANIGALHPNVQYTDRFANYDKKLAATEGNIIRTAGFLGFLGMGIMAGTLTLFREENERDWTLTGIYLGTAALCLGWGSLTRSGTERLERQIGWLVNDGRWDTVQNTYNIRGPAWATFARTLYDRRGNDGPLSIAMTGANPITEEQRKAVLAQTPDAIRENVTAMLDSPGPPKGKDFRTFGGFLTQATTQDARDIALAYLQSGTSRQSLAILASNPQMQEKVKKAGAVSPGPTPPTPPGGLGAAPIA